MNWLQIIWNRKPTVILKEQGMPVPSAFKCYLTLKVKSLIHALNTDLEE